MQAVIAEGVRVRQLRRDLTIALSEDFDLDRHSLGDLIHRYLKRTRRLISPRKRSVFYVRQFWDSILVARHLEKVFALAKIVTEGADLAPYLSARAHNPGKHPHDLQHDGDFALAAYDVHHLHFDPAKLSGSRKVRHKDKADALLFATFGRDDAAFIMVGTHKSFHDGTLENAVVHARADAGHMVLRGVKGELSLNAQQRTRMGLRGVNTAADVGGQAVISSLVMGNGSSMRTLTMADFTASRVHEIDPILDDVERARAMLGPRVPDSPIFSWHFDHIRLVLFEAKSGTAFDFSDLPS